MLQILPGLIEPRVNLTLVAILKLIVHLPRLLLNCDPVLPFPNLPLGGRENLGLFDRMYFSKNVFCFRSASGPSCLQVRFQSPMLAHF